MTKPVGIASRSGLLKWAVAKCGLVELNHRPLARRLRTDIVHLTAMGYARARSRTWKPRQTPKYGFLFSRHHFAQAIFPSTPRSPNPPGTRIPSAPLTIAHDAMYLELSFEIGIQNGEW